MPVRIVTAGGSPVRVVTSGGDPVRIVTQGISDPVRVMGDCGIAPIYLSGEVGNVDDTTVVIAFSSDVTAPCGDYALGFTIYVNGVADAITAAVLSASDAISFTITTAVINGDAVTISYDSAVGCVTESCGVTDLETFTGESITNNVVSAIWYRAGGAPVPIAAYQPKGAASLAASYVNLANPGTYDAAPGAAPAFDTAIGWTFTAGKYLTTGIDCATKPSTGIARVTPVNITSIGNILSSSINGGMDWYRNSAVMALSKKATTVIGSSSGFLTTADRVVAYTYGAAGAWKHYNNGAADLNGTNNQTFVSGTWRISVDTNTWLGVIAALVVYGSELSPSQVLAVSTAMAAL